MTNSRAKRKLTCRRLSLSRLRSESGFALVEVMVSAVLLVVVGLATFSVIDQSAGQSASNRSRAIAVSLAEQDQDRLRAIPFTALGDVNETTTKTIRGITYTVVSQAQYASDTAGVVPCAAGSGAVQYLQIGTTVTWPNMKSVKPVRVESLVTPNVGNVDGGALVVVLTKADGTPQPGIPVTAAGATKTTDTGGCARWTNLTPGSYTVSFSQPGYLTPGGVQAVSDSVSVVTKQTSNVSYSYDQAATINASFKFLDGTADTWSSVTVASGTAVRVMPVSASSNQFSSFAVAGLYPFVGGYKVYAGRCAGNNPETYASGFFGTNPGAAVIPAPGSTAPASAYLRRITLTISKTNATTLGTRQPRIQVSPLTSDSLMAGCTESLARYAGNAAVASVSSNNRIDLPFGLWNVCVDDNRNTNSVRVYTTVNNTPAGSTTYPPTGPAVPVVLNSGATGQC